MRIAAVFLLVIAFVLDMLEGAGYLVLGLTGADMPAMLGDIAGEHAAMVQGELDQFAELMALVGAFGGAVAATGVLVMLAGALALTAAIRLSRQRPGTIIAIGCAAAIIADAAALELLGFSYLQLPGLAGGLLGIFAARSLHAGVARKPAARPLSTAVPAAGARPGAAIKARPTVRTTAHPRPDPDAAPGTPSRAVALISVGAVLIVGALVAYLAYPRYFGQGAAETPTPITAPVPAPPPGKETARTSPPPAPAPEIPAMNASGPVQGQLAGLPFQPERAALKVSTPWTAGGGRTRAAGGTARSKSLERLSLVLDAGEDLQLEITDLPDDYAFASGLTLRVAAGPAKSGQPRLTLRSPQSGSDFPKTDIVSDRYDLDLKLEPLRGNRVDGRISLSLPSSLKTRFAGKFKAWVDGHPEIEPDLTRGGLPTFKYIAFQYLRDIHPGSEISIKDDTYSHQVGDASTLLRGHVMVVYTVDGEEAATILRISTSEGYWRVLDSLDATYLPEAHPIEVPDPSNEGQWVNYLAATHTEEWFREEHPGQYPWSVRFTGTSNTAIGYAEIHLRLKPYGESDAIERRYYFLRNDGRWRYIRDLKKEEQIDPDTGKVVKIVDKS